MKNLKISDFRIPLTILFVSALAIVLAILVDNEVLGTIAGFTIGISLILLIFVYYPIVIVKLFKGKLDNSQNFVTGTGILSVSFIILGILFKLFHVPGAGPIIIFG
ncbi:MAG: hypothetical protein ACK452_01090, partial [Bacteroidota bacterium]